MRRAVFLDRDGVINQTVFRDGKPRAPYSLDEFVLFSGVKEATDILRSAGYLLIIVTNQPDVARGWVDEKSVHMINSKIKELISIDDVKICFHTEKDQCLCRKPKPGMLIEAAEDWQINLPNSYMIGDRFSDIEAGHAAGCTTILIGEGDGPGLLMPHFRMNSLLEAAHKIVG